LEDYIHGSYARTAVFSIADLEWLDSFDGLFLDWLVVGGNLKKGKKRAVTGFGVFLGFMLMFAVFFYINFTTIEVSGISMMPTLHDHQRVLVSRAYWLIGPIKDKDIIVLKDPHGPGDIIKRVCYMAGESVPWDLRPESAPLLDNDYRVPDGCVYVLGDNRSKSEDSRRFGAVDMSNIIGKVVTNK